MLNRRICIAPMMDWTDRHCRYFHRLLTRHAILYTEMITTSAILQGNCDRLLAYHTDEHPVALQLGGSDPKELAMCAKIVEDRGYDEVNLNVGCPSDRVQSGCFGAYLMREPELVAACIAAMQKAVKIPVTIKTRIGIDHNDDYEFLIRFIAIVAGAGCQVFIIHARKAWLHGLSPKENRELPPLHYERVHQLKRDFPSLNIIINGGLKSVDQIQMHLNDLDGAMIGRVAYHNPYLLSHVDHDFYHKNHVIMTRFQVMEIYAAYMDRELKIGTRLGQMSKPILGLFQGIPGARAWRRYLSEHVHEEKAEVEVIEKAISLIEK